LQENGFVSDYETEIIRKDGTHIWISFSATIFPEQGFLEGSIVDITERKRSEIERMKLQDQLNQALKMESVGRLAGGVAHDFNNMLSIILGNVEIIMEDIDQSIPLVTNLEEIYKAAERSANLTRQLLAFARKQTIAPKILNLNHVIDDMLKMLKRLIGEDIDLTWQPAQNLEPVKIDPSQIDQILANLCVNARGAIKSGGKVTIETDNISFDAAYCKEHAGFNPGNYVMMAVSDDGAGMDKKTLDNLFEPFFTTKDIGQGTGLGLATVYGIVKQNNGFINVYSEPGEGTTFKIYLPVHSEPAVSKQKDFKETSQKGNETILLVEDEEAILMMTKMMLERLGYTVLTASGPNEAISIVEASDINSIHLLMTDVVMPEMNGRDLSKKLLSMHPGLKCLFMSGYTANVIAHHGVLDTWVRFINKPFSRQDLATKVREVLDEVKGSA
jgi:signal transduction histidine kinase/CheY-like chemotaxis protein